jgi:hypothetical protein
MAFASNLKSSALERDAAHAAPTELGQGFGVVAPINVALLTELDLKFPVRRSQN